MRGDNVNEMRTRAIIGEKTQHYAENRSVLTDGWAWCLKAGGPICRTASYLSFENPVRGRAAVNIGGIEDR